MNLDTPQTSSILGSPLAVIDYAQAVELARRWSQIDRVHAVEAANTHVVALARHDARFRKALENFDLLLPDGMPLVWCMNRNLPRHQQLADRVYGPTFMLRSLQATAGDPAIRHFLLGGSRELLVDLEERLVRQIPNLKIAGSYPPPFGDWDVAEDERIFTAIRNANANHIWVGLGCPKQELWIARNKSRLPAGVYFAVGAAFAFHAGRVRQAPTWLQARGLEWLYRLCMEPQRLAGRYLRYNSLFLFYLAKDSLRKSRS